MKEKFPASFGKERTVPEINKDIKGIKTDLTAAKSELKAIKD